MDPQHPHEQEHNDLEELFIRLRHFWAVHGTKVLIVVTILAVGFTAKRYMDTQAAIAKQNAWQDLAFATSPDSYLNVAQTHENSTIKALAHLRAADLLLFTALKPDIAEGMDPAKQIDNQKQNLDEAVIRYNKVIEETSNPLLFRINAHLGLAAVAETRKDWSQAESEYDTVIELADTGYETLNTYATARKQLIPRLKLPVVFAPNPSSDEPLDTSIELP